MTLGSHLRLTPALFCGDPPFSTRRDLCTAPSKGAVFFDARG